MRTAQREWSSPGRLRAGAGRAVVHQSLGDEADYAKNPGDCRALTPL
jgi:hypothetical protein